MKPPNELQEEADFGLLRAWLARPVDHVLGGGGVSQADINEQLGSSPAGRTRAEITQVLIVLCQNFPKAV